MTGQEQLLLQHFTKYPAMQPQDAVKLLYQASFGGGHLITNPEVCFDHLQEELSSTQPDAAVPAFEEVGGGWARMNLANPAIHALPCDLLYRIFACSAAHSEAGIDFTASLDLLRRLAVENRAPFSAEALEAYLAPYLDGGAPAVHHSEIYRAAYQPAYRIVDARYTRLLPLLSPMTQLLERSKPSIIAIDGRAASGKSTAAALLSELYGASIVHMDDFFLPLPKRTPERLAEPGGNVDYERFAEEVLPHLSGAEDFSYHRFDCSKMALGEAQFVPATQLRIVEGSYSHHPYFGSYADLRVFSDISPELQLARIAQRNGEEKLKVFQSRWIPMEERYFQSFRIRENAEIVLR